MKIKKREKPEFVTIQDLVSGDVFLYEGDYYILTDIECMKGLMGVDLQSGEGTDFSEADMVSPIRGTFIID